MPTNSVEHREISNESAAPALQPLPPGVLPGARLTLRGTRWRLEQAIVHDDCCELHVASATHDERRVFLWPFDRPVAVDGTTRFTVVRLRHWWHAIVAAHAREVAPWTPRARTVHAEVRPYQLEPAIAMARGALRLVLADEVGLGKTVQAGWIVADLIERERDARVLIAVPAGLRHQWQTELDTLFGVAATGVDAAWLRAAVADRPADVSPWSAPGVYLGSIDFLKRPDLAASLQSQVWNLLVVDEAHGATAPTDRHAALSTIAVRSHRVVSITATPFSGEAARFSSLIALGSVTRDGPPPVMFRRSREDTGDPRRRRHRFVAVRITRAEFRLQRLLERYSRDVWREAVDDVDGARLAVTILRKRALSSPAAAERSLRRRLTLLQGAPAAPRQLSFFEEEDGADDDLVDTALAVQGLADATRERRWLAAMSAAAAAAGENDSKLRRLVRFLERSRGEPAIVFTEYRDTLRHLAARLPHALQLHGGMGAAERVAIQRRFNEDGGWLLATDAASEGLNLQHRCRLILNYELPWNPARLEQRIGRVDRIGQRRPVHAITFVARDTAEDLVVANVTKRLARVAATLGERDRLAAFLDEARIARRVIGAAEDARAAEEGLDTNRIDAAALAPPNVSAAAGRSAAEIVRMASAGPTFARVPIASMRATRVLRSGWLIALRAAAQTASGALVAERVLMLHLSSAVPRQSSPSDARRSAGTAVQRLIQHMDAACPQLQEWFDEIAGAHAAAVDAQIGRETALRDMRRDAAPVQRGLFDRRSVAAADRQCAQDAALHDAASERILRLQHDRPLQRVITPAGVLILWR